MSDTMVSGVNDAPKYLIVTIDDETTELIVRCIEALEIERNNAMHSGDPAPDALACIDADIRRLGGWINWFPERMRAA